MERTYQWVRALARLALSYYYAEVEIHGAGQVPATGPLLVVANHQISLVDPLLLAVAIPRPLRFLAKASLFRIPFLATLMRKVGTIPVHRREDGAANHDNTTLYDALADALGEGAAIGIFPEGVSHDNPMLGEFRHGAARIALDSEARAGFELGLQILVVGIHIEDSRLFRGRVLLNIAAPFTIKTHEGQFRKDPRATIEAVTQLLKAKLADSVLEAEDHEDLRLAALIETLGLVAADQPGMRGVFDRKKFILDQYRQLGASHPTQVALIRELLILYESALEFQPPADAGDARDRLWIRAIAALLRQVLFVAPVIALGLVANAAPYFTVRALATGLTRLQGRGQDVRASLGVMLGVPFFLAWYLLLTWAALTGPRPWLALGLVAVSPVAGLASVVRLNTWKQAVRRLLVSITSYLTRGEGQSTERLRVLLRDQIARLYEAGQSGDHGSGH